MPGWSSQPGRGGPSSRTLRFVRAVRMAREDRRWSRRRLGEEIARVSPETPVGEVLIRDLELGRRAVLTLDEALAICAGLNVSLGEMIDYEWQMVRVRVSGDEEES